MSGASLIPKQERSPTPPLSMTPKCSGVKFVAPLPIACRKTSPNYRDARLKWLRSEVKILKALGLRVPKQIIRDDGMSLEWESDVPRWPDSLQPATLSDDDASPVPVEDVSPTHNASETLHEEEDEYLDQEGSELEDMAVDYLTKYAKAFDTDRSALAGAYSPNALFSYCVHEHVHVPRNSVAAAFTNPSGAVHRFAPRKRSRNLRLDSTSQYYSSGPSEIVPTLLSLGPHKFCGRSPTDLRWNSLALRINEKHLVYISSHGDVTDEKAGVEKRLSFDQCFLLQKSEGSEGEVVWPLVAISHQMTVRDLSLRPMLL